MLSCPHASCSSCVRKLGFALQGDLKALCESYPMWAHVFCTVHPLLPLEASALWADDGVMSHATMLGGGPSMPSSLTSVVQMV